MPLGGAELSNWQPWEERRPEVVCGDRALRVWERGREIVYAERLGRARQGLSILTRAGTFPLSVGASSQDTKNAANKNPFRERKTARIVCVNQRVGKRFYLITSRN